jgi:hypothetical protein
MWRPDNWKNPNPITPEAIGKDIHCQIESLYKLYEDGADAMQKALIDWIKTHSRTVVCPDVGDEFDAYLVPIKSIPSVNI